MSRLRTACIAFVFLMVCFLAWRAPAQEGGGETAAPAATAAPPAVEGAAEGIEAAAPAPEAPEAPRRLAPGQLARAVWAWPSEGEARAAQSVDQWQRAGINTIFLLVFSGGHAAYPSRVFPQQDELRAQDPVAVFVNEARARGMRIFAAIDTLYWQRPGTSSSVVAAHPERMERSAEGEIVGDDGRPGGAFASPASHEVVSLLQEFVAELAARYQFDGLALDYARLARSDYLGYGMPSRVAYLLASGMDPADIDPLGYATSMEARRGFAAWQESQVSALVQRLSDSFRRVRQGGYVTAVVVGGYYDDRLVNPVRQDWITWAQKGWVDSVIAVDVALDTLPGAVSQKAALARGHQANVLAAIASLPAGPQVGVADAAGFSGTVFMPGPTRTTLEAMVRSLGGP